MTTMHSNDTLGNTSLNWTSNQLVTSFMLIKVFSVPAVKLSMFLKLSKLSSTGVLEEEEGGGGNRLPVK